MRVLTVTPWFPSFPGEQLGCFVWDSVDAVRLLGNECSVVVSTPWRPRLAGLFSAEWRRPSTAVSLFPSELNIRLVPHFSIPRNYFRHLSTKLYERKVGAFLTKQVLAFKPDVIHAHTEWTGCVAVQVGQQHRVPVVTTVHGVDEQPRLNRSSQLSYLKHWLTQAARIVLVGESLSAHFSSVLGSSENFTVVENGYRLWGAENTAPGGWGDSIKLISVSNLNEGKGIELTIRALASLMGKGVKNWTYKIVGDGPMRKTLEQLVGSCQLQEKVHFVGRCEQKDVPQHLDGGEVFVLPSYREAFGIAYLEAMAIGLLAIGVKGQGPEAFIEDGATGFLIEPRSVESLTDCLERVLSAPLEMKDLASAGQAHVQNDYSLKNHGQKLLKVYEQAIDSYGF